MGLLDGKKALIFGVANKDSIAWGITQALHKEGASIALSYGLDKLERRVRPLAEQVDCDFVELCDVSSDEELDAVFEKYAAQHGNIDILIHSIGFAPREDLGGRFSEISRDGFRITLDISAYSLIALAQRARPLMSEGGSILAMTYYAAEKVIPGYNVMAIAKAALETSVRYLASDLGPDGIRVNAVSAGPIKTLAASGIGSFRKMMNGTALVAPLRKLVSQDEVGDASVWLSSDWARSVTGEILHVDAGYNVLGITIPEEDL
jgi:enoyl-[acyl-carrier protein] reductase I